METVYRTARIGLRCTPAQTRRCFGLLVAAGDVWAALIEVNMARFRRRARPIANYQEWCREIAGVRAGELSVTAMRSVVRRYSDAFFTTTARKQAGEAARYPRRRRRLFPVRWYHETFALDGRRLRDVTAALPVEAADVDPDRIAGVDLGIIHPYAVAIDDQALLVSGRAIRAEERLHLADTKARHRRMSPKTPRRGQRGSRRWRKLRAKQREAEARHRRRVHQGHHEAATTVIDWAIAHRVGTLVVGDPQGITHNRSGKKQNWRLHAWRRTHLMGALVDKAAAVGIQIVRVDERGTSSTCPQCHQRVPKPKGRQFSCPHCGQRGHRDLIAARNIAGLHPGGTTNTTVFVTHRRAGHPPARRDRRRHQMDQQRRQSCPAPGRPTTSGESLEPNPFEDHTTPNVV